jgi:hypothetical protein
MSLEIDAVSRIREKLAPARKLSRGKEWWSGSKFKLNPTVPESEIVAFETLHNLRLPQDYRDFLLHLSNGGVGPPYGIYRFEESIRRYEEGTTKMWPGMPECVAPENERIDFDWDPFLQGTLPIMTEGCGKSVHLVLKGEFKGRVVHLDEEMDGGPVFTWDAGFLSWFERWLDEMVAGWQSGGFQESMPGSCERLWEIAQSPKVTPFELEAVLISLRRCPQFESRFTPAVAAAFSHFSEEVRRAACGAAHRHRLTDLEEHIFRQLDDPYSGVVMGALRTMPDFPVSRWEAKARLLLHHDNDRVAFQAGCLISDAKVMTKGDLLPLIDSSNVDLRRNGIYFWGKCGFTVSDAEWLERRRSDDNLEVRRAVILAASEAKDHKFVPIMREMAQQEGGAFDQLAGNVRTALLPPMWKTWPIWLATLLISFFLPPQALLPLWGLALLISIAWRIWY